MVLSKEGDQMKIIKMFKQWRVLVLIFALFASYAAINFQFENQGVAITSVEQNSSAFVAGVQGPSSETKPTERERILRVNQEEIKTVFEFVDAVEKIPGDSTFRITTNKQEYSLLKRDDLPVGIAVATAPSSNLKKGLELQGGTRVLLQPVGEVSEAEIDDIIDTMENRLNVYGLSDVSIRAAVDLERNRFIVVEVAGASKEEVKDLIASQGSFVAKIGEEIVFEGGKKDVTFVCRKDGTCSRVARCVDTEGGVACRFEFEIALSNDAAERHAALTKELKVNVSNGQRVLEKTIDFYLDGKFVDSLQIDVDLKGQKATRILISGPGVGPTQKEAVATAVRNMNKLQSLLITGSLPTQLEIVKLDTISPSLGEEFVRNTLWIAGLAILFVGLVIYARYRVIKIVIPIMVTVFSEIFLVLGLAALFKNSLDLAAIAGIIAAVGTGVNDQIVIIDEVLAGEKIAETGSLRRRIKSAFFVILAAYATTVAAMLPLLRAGAGLLLGFALVTIAGVTIGVLITRPAFAAMIRVLLEE